MSNTYKVQDALTLAQKMGKGVPFTGIDLVICNLVNATIYKSYPWKDTLKSSRDSDWSEITLTDGNQDFATGLTDIFRMWKFWIARTDVTPNAYRDIDVKQSLSVDLYAASPYQVRAAAYISKSNKFRLEKAVRIPSGSTFKLGGEYQPHPTQLTDLQDTFWFNDEYLESFAHGLVYWAYQMADDARAGSAVKADNDGRVSYTGQLAVWKNAIDEMAQAEDFGNIDGYYPEDSLGSVDGRRYYANDLFPYLIG